MKINHIKNAITIVLLVIMNIDVFAQSNTVEIMISQPDKKIPIQPNMYGIFFEDINFAADGGLYAELVKNRSFDFINSPLMGWLTYGNVTVKTEGGPFDRNPHYVRLENVGLRSGVGVINEGFRGIGVEKDKQYRFSFYARNIDSGEGKMLLELINSKMDIIATGEIQVDSKEWKKYTFVLKPTSTCSHAKLRVDLRSAGTVDLEHISLFPVDTYKGRENGMRKDLAQALEDLHPGVFRFPGGCIIEGNTIETRYNWKNSIGPVENRPVNENRWNYTFQHRFTPDYFQSYGLGFFEYFQLCEDFGADALPVVNCGMACQFESDVVMHGADILPFVQDALDLIEFANGPVTSKWGKVRADMGHPDSFHLKFLAIGNEQWGQEYPPHLEEFMKAINKKYPDIKLIGSAGPNPDGKEFDYLWKEMRRLDVDLVDEHYYRDPNWFLTHATRYDNYPRTGPKVFAGEYACHDYPEKKNSFYSALCESAFMTGIERNSDVVQLATYAPLFAHVDAWQWKPDMIWYDNLRSVKSANYYVQKLYATYIGTEVLNAKSEGEILSGQNGIYVSAAKNDKEDQLIVKLANVAKESKTISIDFGKLAGKDQLSGKQIKLKAKLTDENTLDNPDLIIPKEDSVNLSNGKLNVTVEPESFNVFIIEI